MTAAHAGTRAGVIAVVMLLAACRDSGTAQSARPGADATSPAELLAVCRRQSTFCSADSTTRFLAGVKADVGIFRTVGRAKAT